MAVGLINPASHVALNSYHHVAIGTGSRQVHNAGRVAWDHNGELVAPGDLAGQVAQVYRNVAESLEAAGAGFSDVVGFTWYAAGWQPEMFDAFTAGVTQAAKEFDITTPPASLIGVEILFQPATRPEGPFRAVQGDTSGTCVDWQAFHLWQPDDPRFTRVVTVLDNRGGQQTMVNWPTSTDRSADVSLERMAWRRVEPRAPDETGRRSATVHRDPVPADQRPAGHSPSTPMRRHTRRGRPSTRTHRSATTVGAAR